MKRFSDTNLRLDSFSAEVWIVCPNCGRKAIASVDYTIASAKLVCVSCGYNKETSTISDKAKIIMAAHRYFGAGLWFTAPFKEEIIWAFNPEHLHYLEEYIAADLREHKDRTGFTLIEKLPKFYHDAKNRTSLLKVIAKLKTK